MRFFSVRTWMFHGAVLLGLFALVVCVVIGPIHHGIKHVRQSTSMRQAHIIGLALYSYAHDHGGNYPPGQSSTEVFQQLIDGGYVTYPGTFYLPMAGKSAAEGRQKLRPENVCWDFTAGATAHSPGVLPVVFTTGYRVTYMPGAAAVPLVQPYPVYIMPARTWAQWWNGNPKPFDQPGIGAFYLNNSAKYSALVSTLTSNASVPEFISPDFIPRGETYRQLTPNGPLP